MSDSQLTLHKGGCLCGQVRFQATNLGPEIIYCHCGQCLKTHGNYAAYARVQQEELQFDDQSGLRWYQSSDQASRGFCTGCGASLFWQPTGAKHLSVSAGCLEQPTGLVPIKHIFISDRGDYYSLADDLPCYLESSDGAACDALGHPLAAAGTLET